MSEKSKLVDDLIIAKTDWEHVRLRTEPYLGQRDIHEQLVLTYQSENDPEIKLFEWVPSLFTGFREILDNAIDEYKKGYGNKLDIEYDESNMTISIRDYGRGIPIDWNQETNSHIVTIALSQARTGRNYGDDRGDAAGQNGLGAKAVNYCSEWFEVDVVRNGKRFRQRFSEGDNDLIIDPPYITRSGPLKSGTKISWKFSSKVFSNLLLPTSFLLDRLMEIKLCHQDLIINFNGEEITTNIIKRFSNIKSTHISFSDTDISGTIYLFPANNNHSDYYHSVVNSIFTLNGGVHVDSFKKVFYTEFLNELTNTFKRKKLVPNRLDIQESLIVLFVFSINNPSFSEQAKTRLTNAWVGKYIEKLLKDSEIYQKIIRTNSEWIDLIAKRCSERTRQRENNDVDKDARKALREKNPKLNDATSKDRKSCILVLAEGDSAVNGMTDARNPKIHGGLPLKGKPMNIYNKKNSDLLKDGTIRSIINALGLELGKPANRETLRYGKCYIAHDMDQDGFAIGSLLINLFYRKWPELLQSSTDPYLYIMMTPFIIANNTKTGERRYWYADDLHLFVPNEYKNWEITRAKGLSSLSKEDWEHSLNHPKLFPIVNDNDLSEALDMIFNKTRAADRREWIGEIEYD